MKISAALRLLVLSAAALVLASPARADFQAVTFANPNGQAYALGADGTFGWSFTLSTPLTVTSLGFHTFAPNSPGVAPNVAHEVAIWNSNGQQIADGTVPAGGGTNVNGTYYVTITPVRLTAGTYTIGALVPSSSTYLDMNDTITTIPGVTFNGGRSNYNVGFSNPTGNQSGYTNAYYGPNFLVPEPSTWALLSLGAAGLGLGLRRRVTRA